MKPGFNNDELQQLVKDLKAGKSWDEVVRERCHVLDPGVLEASDYKAWAHREAGIELAEAPPPPPPPPEEPDLEEEPEPEPTNEHESPRGRRGRR
jgi:hypothetical protein